MNNNFLGFFVENQKRGRMWIFKVITDRYCKKILDAYQLLADEKTYKGKEAGLLIMRNDSARSLVEIIKKIDVRTNDYDDYFKQVLQEIDLALKHVTDHVRGHNRLFNTEFTTDLYEIFFTTNLIAFMNELNNLFQKSPSLITSIQDESSFNNNRNVLWVYQFSYVLFEYILEKEFDLIINKSSRDIFDTKKQLVLKYIQSAADLYLRFEKENDAEYKELMNILLQGLRSQEHDIQQRRSQESNSSNMYSYFTQTLYKASEKIMGKGQLGQQIDFLITEFNERSMSNRSIAAISGL